MENSTTYIPFRDTAPLYPQVVFKLNDVLYVSHFRNASVYIGPGYPRKTTARYTEKELLKAGALPVTTMLWSRSLHGVVTDKEL